MKYFYIIFCILIIAILEVALNGFFGGIKSMLANTNPIVGFVLLIIYVEIFVIAKKELAGVISVFKKLWLNKVS